MSTSTSPASLPPEKVNFSFVLLITCVAAIGGFLFGYDSGVINGTVDGLKQAFGSDSVLTGFNVASMLLGCAIGAFLAGWLADRFGRRSILMVAAVFFLVSAWGSGVAGGSLEFVFYRVLGGLAVGAASVLAPAYISEIAPARYRGALASIQQIAIISGLFFSFLSNYFIARAAGSSLELFWFGFQAWRWMFWMEMIPSVIFLVALMLIPESPRYLVAVGRLDAARRTLGQLFGPHAAEQKTEEIRQTLSADHRPRLSDIFLPNGGFRLRPILWIGLMLATFQQLVGINVVFYYGSVLWQSAGFSESHALLINVVSGGVSIAACLLAISIIDRVGRKPLLVIGSVGMTLTLGTMAGVFAFAAQGDHSALALGPVAGPVALIAANLYVFLFNFSWGPVMWVMLGEMFPNQFRGSALAVCGLAQWMANFAITFTFPGFLGTLGLGGAYAFYTLSALVSLFLVLWMVRETKGKDLEEMKG